MATPSAVTTTKADLLPAPLQPILKALMPDVYRLLPADITPDQFRAACWLELTGRQEISDRDYVLESIRDAIIYAANYGLMPGRDCHFLSFRQKKYGNKKGAQCVSNYFGIIRTLDRSGKVRRAFAHPVCEGDTWDMDYFQDRPIHRPAVTLGHKQGRELFYYGAVMFHNGSCAFEVLTLDDLEGIKKRAPAHDSGPWVSDPVMMKRKSAIKRVAKYVQLTPEQREFIQDDEEREREDIPPARARQTIIDVFGETVDPTAYQGRTASTATAHDPVTGEVVPESDTYQREFFSEGDQEGEKPPAGS